MMSRTSDNQSDAPFSVKLGLSSKEMYARGHCRACLRPAKPRNGEFVSINAQYRSGITARIVAARQDAANGSDPYLGS